VSRLLPPVQHPRQNLNPFIHNAKSFLANPSSCFGLGRTSFFWFAQFHDGRKERSSLTFCYHHFSAGLFQMDDEIPSIRIPTEAFMDDATAVTPGARRNEDIALDLMKFIAMTTGYGRTTSSGVGFQGTGAATKPDEYANHLLELYGRCLHAVQAKP